MPGVKEITLTTTVREVMTSHPHLEAVFNKHGLTGCGGRKGPMEPIGFFATVHHVDPDALLAELREGATEEPQEAAIPTIAADQPDIYRIFVKAALAIVVTVGCTLGAVNLAAMALAGVTGSYWEAVTQAHGHAQIFGWVGLFIMGVAYHVLPRLKATELQHRPLAMASFWLVLAGLSLRMIAQPLAESQSWAGIVVLSSISELLGASFFAYVLLATLRSNPASADFWDKYAVASAIWLWVTAAATVGISLYTAGRGLAIIPPGLDAPYLHVSLVGFRRDDDPGHNPPDDPRIHGAEKPERPRLRRHLLGAQPEHHSEGRVRLAGCTDGEHDVGSGDAHRRCPGVRLRPGLRLLPRHLREVRAERLRGGREPQLREVRADGLLLAGRRGDHERGLHRLSACNRPGRRSTPWWAPTGMRSPSASSP